MRLAKRITVTIISILLFISICAYFDSNVPMVYPASVGEQLNRKVIIDAGHGGLTNTTH